MLDLWFIENLVCPRDHLSLEIQGNNLRCGHGHLYPVVDDVPVMLLENVAQTMELIEMSIRRAKGDTSIIDNRAPSLYLESLGVSEVEKQEIVDLYNNNISEIDTVVSYIVGATSGYLYKELIGKLISYPIPEIRLPNSNGDLLLDIGCNWGRWSISAARKGYNVVGIDPSLGAIMAAKRVSKQLGISIRYIVADARFLPFKSQKFQTIFSYSVLQHLSYEDAEKVVEEISRLLKVSGKSLVQMPNIIGIRNFQHQLQRKFRQAENFEVRYWSMPRLRKVFGIIGKSKISVDGFFGLGIQNNDISLFTAPKKVIVKASEFLRKFSNVFPAITYLADSLYIETIKE